jgi:hypothetical protein
MVDMVAEAQASLSVQFAPGGKACVVFQAKRGEGPRSGSIPTLIGALLASSLARMGEGQGSARLLDTVERAAVAFATMRQPNVLPHGMALVEPDQMHEGQTVCTMLIPTEGADFVRGVFAIEDPDVAYKAFLYGLQYAVDSLPPESLVALSSILKGVVSHFRDSMQWPDAATVERELAAGKAGISGR